MFDSTQAGLQHTNEQNGAAAREWMNQVSAEDMDVVLTHAMTLQRSGDPVLMLIGGLAVLKLGELYEHWRAQQEGGDECQ